MVSVAAVVCGAVGTVWLESATSSALDEAASWSMPVACTGATSNTPARNVRSTIPLDRYEARNGREDMFRDKHHNQTRAVFAPLSSQVLRFVVQVGVVWARSQALLSRPSRKKNLGSPGTKRREDPSYTHCGNRGCHAVFKRGSSHMPRKSLLVKRSATKASELPGTWVPALVHTPFSTPIEHLRKRPQGPQRKTLGHPELQQGVQQGTGDARLDSARWLPYGLSASRVA